MTTNQIAYWNLQETTRANKAKEAENLRHNKATEGIQRETNTIQSKSVDNTYTLGQLNYGETQRSNLEKERENRQAHRTSEALTAQKQAIDAYNAETNRLNYGVNNYNAAVNAGQLAEQRRTNLANEAIKSRSNEIAQYQAEEMHRTNLANENLKRYTNAVDSAAKMQNATTNSLTQEESKRHNLVTETETKRNNLYNQYIDSLKLQETINHNRNQDIAAFQRNATSMLKVGGR